MNDRAPRRSSPCPDRRTAVCRHRRWQQRGTARAQESEKRESQGTASLTFVHRCGESPNGGQSARASALGVNRRNDGLDRGVLDEQIVHGIVARNTGDQVGNADALWIEGEVEPLSFLTN